MAHATMSQFAPVCGTKIGCNELSMSTITEVLQSEPVQRLLNRQNVYLQNPITGAALPTEYGCGVTLSRGKANGKTNDSAINKKPELSVIPILSVTEKFPQNSVVDDKHLLPSKYDGKSGIALVPIKREKRRCGHYEPCEMIVCDVNFQQFADENSVSPLIAVNIDATEIDAPVTKHCKNVDCDALSIDHDRCRRAIIRCHRCDVENKCDICSTIWKTRKSQMNHNNCKMRSEYRHNRTSRSQILRDRMRQREIQILEAAKSKQNDYTDPLHGHERAIENLQKNDELIVIPKNSSTFQQQHPTIRITSVTGSSLTPKSQNSTIYEKILSRFPIILPHVGSTLTKRSSENSSEAPPTKRGKIVGTSGSSNGPSSSGNSGDTIVTVTRLPARKFVKTVDVEKLLEKPTLRRTSNEIPTESERFFTPIRVVQTQGVPKYVLVEENAMETSNDRSKSASSTTDSKNEQILKRFKPGIRRGRRKKNGAKRILKSFECTFCFKKFTTDWYFKQHIAKHKGEIKFACKFCKKPFMHLYNMTKHVVTMHKAEAGDESLIEQNIDENDKSLSCANCGCSFDTRTAMENHPCRIVCLRCNSRILDGNLMVHLRTKHDMSDEKVVEEYERQKRQKRQSVLAAKKRAQRRKWFSNGNGKRSTIDGTKKQQSD